MEGEDEDSPDEGAFSNKKPWQKIIILAAGSFMNVVCAILIMALVLGIAGFTTNVIGQVNSGSPAETAGIEEGDEILAINGNPVEDWNDILEQMPTSEESMDILIERDGQQQHIEVTPQLVQEEGENGAQERYVIGITSKISHSPIQALIGGCQSTWNITKLMFQSLAMLFTGEAGADDLTGAGGYGADGQPDQRAGILVLWIFNGADLCESGYHQHVAASGIGWRKNYFRIIYDDNREKGQ